MKSDIYYQFKGRNHVEGTTNLCMWWEKIWNKPPEAIHLITDAYAIEFIDRDNYKFYKAERAPFTYEYSGWIPTDVPKDFLEMLEAQKGFIRYCYTSWS